jgi:hypothetical protein
LKEVFYYHILFLLAKGMKVSLSIIALALAGACWADSVKDDASARLHVPRDDAAKKGKSALRKAAPFIVAAGGFSIAE